MKKESLEQFCDRLKIAADDFSAATGARFHLLRATPAVDAFKDVAPFRIQAILSGVLDQKEGPVLSCGFEVSGARPHFHPHVCMAFDGLDAVDAKFTSNKAIDRAQALFQFGFVDVDSNAVTIHADRGLGYVNRTRLLSSQDPALVEAQVIAYGLIKSHLGAVTREITDASPAARDSLFARSVPHTLAEMFLVARFAESVESRMHLSRPGPKLSSLIEGAMAHATQSSARSQGIFPESALIRLEGMACERLRQARLMREGAAVPTALTSRLQMAM